MTEQHPLNPSIEQYTQWLTEARRLHPGESLGFISGEIARLAYQAGADQELEACCEWITKNGWFADPTYRLSQLLEGRRPKPPSLKQQALQGLAQLAERLEEHQVPADLTVLRRALEALSDD